jgi:hypothetical protein
MPPRSCNHHRHLTVAYGRRPTKPRGGPKPRGAWTAATQEGRTSTTTCGDRPDSATGANQAPLARPSLAGS